MFAHVITAQAGDSGVDDVIRLANQRLPDARQRPGFAGCFLLVNDQAGKIITISLWETREDADAVAQGSADGIHDEGISETATGCWRSTWVPRTIAPRAT